MWRTLEISFAGRESSFKVIKIDRSRLYGSRRRIPIDVHGRECSFASLTDDGRFILPKGSMALLYLDEHGEVVERAGLQAVDAEGKTIPKSDNEIWGVEETVPTADLLDFSITNAYQLEPVFISSNLEESLSQGAVYSLPHFRANGDDNCQAFLLSSDAGYFILSGVRTGFEFIGLAETDYSPPDMDGVFDEEARDDLDFSMWSR